MNPGTILRSLKSDYLLLPIMALAFYMAFIPHQGYPYAVHLDEWLHLAFSKETPEEIVQQWQEVCQQDVMIKSDHCIRHSQQPEFYAAKNTRCI